MCHLFLVPFEIWKKDKANYWVRIFINYPVSLCLLLQDVVYPLGGERDVNPQILLYIHMYASRCQHKHVTNAAEGEISGR